MTFARAYYHLVRVLLLNTNFLKKFDKKEKQKVHAWPAVSATFEAEKLKYAQFHDHYFSSNADFW